jgi:hypothetical protein
VLAAATEKPASELPIGSAQEESWPRLARVTFVAIAERSSKHRLRMNIMHSARAGVGSRSTVRCVVCEQPIRRKTERQKTCIDRKCKAELRRFPLAYSWPEKQKTGNHPSDAITASKTPDFVDSERPLSGDRPSFKCLAHWWWGGDPDSGDHSLYDKEGLTLARLVRGPDGFYHLRSPLTWPRMSWGELEQFLRRAPAVPLRAAAWRGSPGHVLRAGGAFVSEALRDPGLDPDAAWIAPPVTRAADGTLFAGQRGAIAPQSERSQLATVCAHPAAVVRAGMRPLWCGADDEAGTMPAAPSLSRYAAAARRTASNQTLERFLRRCASGDQRGPFQWASRP